MADGRLRDDDDELREALLRLLDDRLVLAFELRLDPLREDALFELPLLELLEALPPERFEPDDRLEALPLDPLERLLALLLPPRFDD